MSDEGAETIVGWLKTHFDCECGEVFEVEGDATGDEVECDVCGAKYVCESVR